MKVRLRRAPGARTMVEVRRVASLALLIAAACDDEAPLPGLDAGTERDGGHGDGGLGDGGLGPDGGPVSDAGDVSAPLFDRSRLLRVEIELAPADWDSLRAQTRTLESTLARPECLDEPFQSPFTYFSARVRVDGVTFERVGVRKKGFLGSLSELKPSLKIKLDEYVPGVEHLGLNGLTLNNSRQDPSLVRTCLGFDVFTAAGVPAPRCSYAEVVVNGVPMGPYVHVESVGKRFLRRHFTDDEGQLYEGTLSDFRDGWLGTFDQETNEATPYDRSDLEGLTRALEAPDAQLEAALAPWIDLDAFIRFWAAEVLADHWDGYSGNTNNFYVYADPTDGLFKFLPWGVDAVFGARIPMPPYSVMAQGLLPRRIYLHPGLRPRYLAELGRQLDDAFDVTAVQAEIDRASALIAPIVPIAERVAVTDATRQLRAFVAGRSAQVRAELTGGGVDWTAPLRAPLCFELGRVDAGLATTFGTHPTNNPFATGTGVYTATVAGQIQRGLMVGSAAGMGTNPDDQGEAVLLVAATLADGSIPLVYVAMDPTLLAPGTVLLDGVQARGALLRIPAAGQPIELVGGFFGGWLEITAGSTAPGAPLEVAIHGQLLRQRDL